MWRERKNYIGRISKIEQKKNKKKGKQEKNKKKKNINKKSK